MSCFAKKVCTRAVEWAGALMQIRWSARRSLWMWRFAKKVCTRAVEWAGALMQIRWSARRSLWMWRFAKKVCTWAVEWAGALMQIRLSARQKLWMWWSHSTQAQSMVSHCWLASPMGEWLLTDEQQGLLWLAAKLHHALMTSSRDIQNAWILSGQPSYEILYK